ncbi:MAG: RNA-binding transcriptional accessory protein [Tissierellia bacterium]|nr:RNA-binding transcriptional accessory protein [Tissierellia bacterium]
MEIIDRLIEEFQIKNEIAANVIDLLDTGNTVPFIARYRKEMTGSMEDMVLRKFEERLNYLRNLEEKKSEVIRLLEESGNLTDELKIQINTAEHIQRVDDIYRPFRPKRRTRATIAKEKGLDPLAELISKQETSVENIYLEAEKYINPEMELNEVEEVINGALDIIAEEVSDSADVRTMIRKFITNQGFLETKSLVDESTVYDQYYDYKEKVNRIPNHSVLAINRAEREKIIKANILVNEEIALRNIYSIFIKNNSPSEELLKRAIDDSYKRLLFPSVEREIRNQLTEIAEEDAIGVFAMNLKPLLMSPPIRGKKVLAIDPGFRTGCKVAVLDQHGEFLENTTIYPTEPFNKVRESKETLKKLVEKYGVDIIAIGNGTASRETEKVVADMIQEENLKVSFIIVNEAGASIYSASEVGIEEFPELDVTVRGAISIGRRLQDPLAELVKIEPKHIGVGQYQHDLNAKKMDSSLSGVVEDCVNSVGVDLNTASVSLLNYISGINNKVANNIVTHRLENGKFNNRNELKKVKGLGPKAFEQSAGFLRIPDSENILDNTGVHPESYKVAKELIKLNYKDMNISELSEKLDIGRETLSDIINELEKPGRDPRDEMPKPILRTDVLSIEDLEVGMELLGTVRNVVGFGAFIDIGIKNDGLVHISEMSDRFIKDPNEVVKVVDIVTVWIKGIDKNKQRVSLTMKGAKAC